MADLTPAQELKLGMLAEGVVLTASARSWLEEVTAGRGLTPADYASTSGLILRLEDDVWVNAPFIDHNPNFVDVSQYMVDLDGDELCVRGPEGISRAWFWPQPEYHGRASQSGPINNYVVTHGDRARLSPIRSCSMICDFCNIPYDDPISVYATKPIAACVDALATAFADPLQPAQHILISGGTPKPKDVPFEQELYRAVLTRFAGVDVDIMMAPVKGVLDLEDLARHGIHELSVNVEIFDKDLARGRMRSKYNQGLDSYLDFIAAGTEALGPSRIRSILLVGLEPVESTLAGVKAIAERGGVPVLSPFRPDLATPMANVPPPSATTMREVFLRAREITEALGTYLGPDCPPCTHNTLGFAEVDGAITYRHTLPEMI